MTLFQSNVTEGGPSRPGNPFLFCEARSMAVLPSNRLCSALACLFQMFACSYGSVK